MLRTWTRAAMLRAGVVGLIVAAPAAAQAAEQAPKPPALVKQALREGLDGRFGERNRLLREALEAAPENAAAHWHLGEVKVNNKWMAIEDVVAASQQNLKQTKYRKLRSETADTAAAQLELANYCAKQGLLDEERAHLTRVVELEPEHPQARARLGFRMVAGQWISKEEQDTAAQRNQAAQQGLKKWEGKVQAIRKGLLADSPKARETAAERARAIDDPSAISALELVLAPASEDASLLAVETIGKMKGLEAARAIGRLAVISPWPNVRNSAAQQLKSRSYDSYVPAMLATVYTPVQSRGELYQGGDGRIMYRHLFYREGQDQKQTAVLETEYRQAGGDAAGAMALALTNIDARYRQREAVAADQNRVTSELNDRIFRTLQISTGESLPNEPERWWQWWGETNETFLAEKSSRTYYQQEQVNVSGPSDDSSTTTSHECLAAGTLVMTDRGLTPIEKIELGDRVLSQHPETGELAYKPVLRTTIRPASRLVKIKVGYETFESTGAHPFWEAGKGWVKASQLKAQTRLHQPTGASPIEAVEEGKYDFTYNLVVADFHTYFVGKSLVLSHDNTAKEATEAVEPGLIEK